MRRLKVINLFGGPGIGKSTTRAELFSILKKNQVSVEEVTEYAKDKTWEKNFNALSDQLYVLANQNRRLDRLKDQVAWAVSDSPILLGIHYKTPDYLPSTFEKLILELWNTYDNINFVLERDSISHPYSTAGRTQSEEQARMIDTSIIDMLNTHSLPYINIKSGNNAAMQIFDYLKQQYNIV